jgi:hypothetical protein
VATVTGAESSVELRAGDLALIVSGIDIAAK